MQIIYCKTEPFRRKMSFIYCIIHFYFPCAGELFPPNVKEAAAGLATMVNWTLSFSITLIFVPLQVSQVTKIVEVSDIILVHFIMFSGFSKYFFHFYFIHLMMRVL